MNAFRRIITAFLFVLLPVVSSASGYKNILLRDFRTVKDGQVVNYNIGTAAHAPATIAVLKKYLPDDVRITVWADAPLCPELAAMMASRWPEIGFVYGVLDSSASSELLAAVEASELLLVSSGSGIPGSVRRSILQYRELTGKPTAAYAIGGGPADLYCDFDFLWLRDEKALEKVKAEGRAPAICGFAPDAVFDFDCVDEKAASAFMKKHRLKAGKFICCLPGARFTPRWEFFGGPVDEERSRINAEKEISDNSIICEAICRAVRERGVKVLICPEQVAELRLCKEAVYDRLPADVRRRCVCMTSMWSPQMALAVYKKSRAVFGIEMHSQVMSLGNGVPAVVLRHSGFGTKSDMWNTLGLGEWLIDIDDADARGRACAALDSILASPADAAHKVDRARKIIDEASESAVRTSFGI